MTLETVAGDTPAIFATSLILVILFIFPRIHLSVTRYMAFIIIPCFFISTPFTVVIRSFFFLLPI